MQIVLKGLPKISLNTWYAGSHWSKRKKIKDNYYFIIKSQCSHIFKKDSSYDVEYIFEFKNKPLDASNTVAMVKMIEDVLFEDDKFDIVTSIKMASKKGKEDIVKLIINQI